MKLPRRYRLLTVLTALFGMLFMQLAVAAYACPGLKAGGGGTAVAEAMSLMPDCDQQPDADRSAVCHAHCQDAKASPDKAELPAVSAAAVTVATILSPLEPVVAGLRPGFEPLYFLQRITAPPISIRHCCFRI